MKIRIMGCKAVVGFHPGCHSQFVGAADFFAVRKFRPVLCVQNSLRMDRLCLTDCDAFRRYGRRYDYIHLAYAGWNAADQSGPARKYELGLMGALLCAVGALILLLEK